MTEIATAQEVEPSAVRTTSFPSPPLYEIWKLNPPAVTVAPSGSDAKVPIAEKRPSFCTIVNCVPGTGRNPPKFNVRCAPPSEIVEDAAILSY